MVNLTADMIITPKEGIEKTIPLPDTGALVEIAFPLPPWALGKTGYRVTRYHDGEVQSLKQIAPGGEPDQESFYIAGGYVHIFAQKFSSYAVTFAKPGSGGSNPGWTSSTTDEYFTIDATVGKGGTITPSGSVQVLKNDDQTFVITPDKGMQIAKVLVDGAEVALKDGRFTFKNVTEAHTISVTFAEEEKPAAKPTVSPPTGDSTNLAGWLLFLVISAAGLVAVDRLPGRMRRFRRRQER